MENEIYFLFFAVLWIYSSQRSVKFYIGWFLAFTIIITGYDLFRVNEEIAELTWKTWIIPIAYMFVTLVLAAFTNLDNDKTVPERVTA